MDHNFKSCEVRVMVLVFCISTHWAFQFQFHENISNDFQTQGRTKTTVFIVQRAIIPKVVKQELWLLSSAHGVMVLLHFCSIMITGMSFLK